MRGKQRITKRDYQKRMKKAAHFLEKLNQPQNLQKSPLVCRSLLNKFYEDLKRRHQQAIGCTKILNESQAGQEINQVLEQQLKELL